MTEKECHHSHDLDISLQVYTYVHETNKNTDSTDYGDNEYNTNEPDNIRYLHNYINYSEAGATTEPTGNDNNNNDEENERKIMMKKIILSILSQYH